MSNDNVGLVDMVRTQVTRSKKIESERDNQD